MRVSVLASVSAVALVVMFGAWSPSLAQCQTDAINLTASEGTDPEEVRLIWTSCGGHFLQMFRSTGAATTCSSENLLFVRNRGGGFSDFTTVHPSEVLFYRVTPQATCESFEICGDGLDEDCNCVIDDGCPCTFICEPCPSFLFFCDEQCFGYGECNPNKCNPVYTCTEGYKWNQSICSCVRHDTGPETCGSVTCAPGTKCCNAITGSCVKNNQGCVA